MAISAAVAVGAAVAGPKILEATGLTQKPPDLSQLTIEQPPAPAPASPQATNAAGESPAAQAAAAERRRAAASQGRSGTIKTGSTGLGEIASDNVSRKTLLGY